MEPLNGCSTAATRQLGRAAVRFPEAARAYRSGRRAARHAPRTVKRSLRPLAIRARQLPLPQGLLEVIWRFRTRHHDVVVPIDRLLIGGENGLSGADYAELTDQPLRPSTPIGDSPYVELLEQAEQHGGLGDWFEDSAYLANALRCVEVSGHYFGAVDAEGIRQRAQAFIDAEAGHDGRPPSSTPTGRAVRVRPIRRSDHYEIVDGHHRVARAWHAGQRELTVDIERGGSWTPLQQLLNSMSWIDGTAELYQPVQSPELAGWSLVRNCSDRLDKMTAFLADRPAVAGDRTYLDVGSCYGWFVHRMAEQGWDARGIELDPLARRLGQLVYGLDPARVTIGDCAEVLDAHPPADVVSCFSVLHHFALGKGSCTAEQLMKRLDTATGSVLFLDTGQAHERWFADTLPEWDVDHIERWILANSSFRTITLLGVDEDAVPPYQDNYGRMLFACTR